MRWRDGKAAELWGEVIEKKKVPKQGRKRKQREKEEPTQLERNVQRATRLAGEGQLGRAAKALVSRGVDMKSAEARQEMVNKHPQAEVASPPQEEHSCPPILLTSREVYEAVRGFKSGTAAGPSGLRSEHLKEAKGRGEGRGAAALGAVTKLVNTMAAGKVPKDVAPYLFGANLFALLKKGRGHRPVAVEDILRRLTSKCIAYKVNYEASQWLMPLQFGVGVRGGCEAIVHATRATLESQKVPDSSKWSLQTDFENGFNNLDRSKMFVETRRRLPSISPWVESCYGVESVLNFGEGSIKSTVGAHQGDPLAGLLFCSTLHPVVEMLEKVKGLEQNSRFQDDGELLGTREALVEAWDILVREGVPRGLHLSKEKSLVFCPHHDPDDQDPLGRGITRVQNRGIKLLGAPIGEADFEAEILEQRVVSIQQLLESLHHLNDPHIEYNLLRSCFSLTKFSYSIRTVDTSQHSEIMETFDTAVRGALEATIGSPLSSAQWNQASLPIHMGGLGLLRATDHGPAAYLASLGATGGLVEEIRCEDEEEPQKLKVEQVLQALNCQLGDPLTLEGLNLMTQRQISGLVDTESASRVLQSAEGERNKARLNCLAREGAGDWLTAIPSKALGLHLRRIEFITAVKYRLGLPIFLQEGECPVPRCRSRNDIFGDHAISCGYGGERIAKHNHVRDALFQSAVQASLGPIREPDGLLPGSDERPADLLIPYWHHGKDAAIDFTVVNPLQAALVGKVAQEGAAGVSKAHQKS